MEAMNNQLKEVVKEHPTKVHLINIDSWKLKIQKAP